MSTTFSTAKVKEEKKESFMVDGKSLIVQNIPLYDKFGPFYPIPSRIMEDKTGFRDKIAER